MGYIAVYSCRVLPFIVCLSAAMYVCLFVCDDGLRLGSFGVSLYSLSCSVYSLLTDKLDAEIP